MILDDLMRPAMEFLEYALNIGALELIPEGWVLKSGRISPYFFNSGLFYTGKAISMLAEAYKEAIVSMLPQVIFGPAYKGIPLAVAVAQSLGGNVGWAFNRKEAKDHGEGGILVGAPMAGKRVIIVDDVITTGGSAIESIEIVKAAGGKVIGYAIAFDRQEWANEHKISAVLEFENRFKIPVFSAAKLSDLIELLKRPEYKHAEGVLNKIFRYKHAYGV